MFNLVNNLLKKRIIIHGGGGNTRTIIAVLKSNGIMDEIICIDKPLVADETILGVKVFEKIAFANSDIHLISYGDNQHRAEVYNEFKEKTFCIGNCIASDAIIYSKSISANENLQVFNRVYIGPDVIVGNNNIINTGAIIEHEVTLKDHLHIAPGSVICGRATIGNYVFVGANSVVRDKISICDNVTIGAGSVVISSIEEPGVYVGNPVRKIN